jgi:hypothetical protein
VHGLYVFLSSAKPYEPVLEDLGDVGGSNGKTPTSSPPAIAATPELPNASTTKKPTSSSGAVQGLWGAITISAVYAVISNF